MPSATVIPFFTDQNVPDSVGRVLKADGHTIVRLRDVMDVKTADPVIAVACANAGHVLVSHDGDFRRISRRLKITNRAYQNSLHRIGMRCPEPNSAKRIIEALPLIEFEWARLIEGRPMVVEITDHAIKVWR